MSAHSFFSPSKGAMWMECAGALAMPENQAEGTSSTFADSGTASHTLGSWALENRKNCADFPHAAITIRGVDYEIDEERIERIQTYVDDVRREALGGLLFTEYRVDLSRWLGMAPCWACQGTGQDPIGDQGYACRSCKGSGEEPQGGTSDAIIIQPRKKLLIVADLKDGAEKVWAKDLNGKINHQLGLYGGGVLNDIMLLGHEIERVILRIYQPPLDHIDEVTVTPAELFAFMEKAKEAAELAGMAMTMPVEKLDENGYLVPGDKTCRWCAAKIRCPAYTRVVEEETRMNFDDESSTPEIPETTEHLSRAYAKLAMVEAWVKAVKSGVWKAVNEGKDVLGPDGLPMKFVNGPEGKRVWVNPEKAEAALVGQLGERAYEPAKVITAPAAAKILDKKATRTLWEDIFAPIIRRAKGGPQLVLGSDPRPVYGGSAADANDFDEEIGVSE